MGVYRGIAQDNVTINSGKATLQNLTVTGTFVAAGGVQVAVSTLVAAGTSQATATQASFGLNVVSAGDGTKAIRLPTAVAGSIVFIKNTAAGALPVYPATGGTINALSANAAYSMATLTSTMLIAASATQWYSIPLVAS